MHTSICLRFWGLQHPLMDVPSHGGRETTSPSSILSHEAVQAMHPKATTLGRPLTLTVLFDISDLISPASRW